MKSEQDLRMEVLWVAEEKLKSPLTDINIIFSLTDRKYLLFIFTESPIEN